MSIFVGTARCPSCGAANNASLPDALCVRCLLGCALDAELPVDDPDSIEAAPSEDENGQQIGRYRLLEEIERGGGGVVYSAWDADLKRRVALKMLLPARRESQQTLDRFRREAELMASLDHPGVLPIYEVGEQGGLPFFAMKFAERGNLAQRIGALRGQYRVCARLVATIARAVAYAHGRGVLHRDLKPSNIVFDRDDAPLVTDFGLARLLAEDSTLTGSDALIGTPRYVAPEVVLAPAAKLTAATDIYGLGAILYELLCGRAPFADLAPLQVLQQVATRRPMPPRQIDASVPSVLEAICLRCIEKRPYDRYSSAVALADALDAWLAGTKVGLLRRFGGSLVELPSRRRRAVIVVGTLFVAAVCVLLTDRFVLRHGVNRAIDPEAYALFLQARQINLQHVRTSYEDSIPLLQQVLAKAPDYAPAWGSLAMVYLNQATFGGGLPVPEAERLAREAINKELAADPNYAGGYAHLGFLEMNHRGDLPAAARHLEKALALDPDNPVIVSGAADLALDLGRRDLAIALGKASVALDPINPMFHYGLGGLFRESRRSEDAIASFRSALRLSPGFAGGHAELGGALLQNGEFEAALAEVQKEQEEYDRLLELPLVYHALGRLVESDAALATLIAKYEHEKDGAYFIASVLAYRGETDRAFEWLDKAQADQESLYDISVEPLFDNIRDDPRWLPFLRKVGKAPEQLAAIRFEPSVPRSTP